MSASPYRLVFFGTPDFAVPALRALLDHGEEVAAVVCQPDKPKGRGRRLTMPPVKELALASGIPVLQPLGVRCPKFFESIRAFSPDLLVVAAYGRILPGALLALPPLGAINVHGSLLPAYRGAAPVQWAILNGESETGITIMQMDEGMDTGDILLQGALAIDEKETSGSLAQRMAELGGRLLIEALERLKRGELRPRKQDEALASLAPPLTKEMAVIDWSRPAVEIARQIRGLDPWPMAHTTLDGKWLRLFAPELACSLDPQYLDAAPGTLCRADSRGLLIATGRGLLTIGELQLEGGKRMQVDAFLRGRPLAAGLRFPG